MVDRPGDDGRWWDTDEVGRLARRPGSRRQATGSPRWSDREERKGGARATRGPAYSPSHPTPGCNQELATIMSRLHEHQTKPRPDRKFRRGVGIHPALG